MVNSSLPHRACEYSRIRKRRERVRSLRFLARRKTCFHMASFGHFLVQIWTEPLSNPDAPSRNYCWFAPRWLHLDTILPRSGSSQLRTHARLPKVRSTSVEREHILQHLDRQASSENAFLNIWIDERRAKPYLAVHWNHRLAHSWIHRKSIAIWHYVCRRFATNSASLGTTPDWRKFFPRRIHPEKDLYNSWTCGTPSMRGRGCEALSSSWKQWQNICIVIFEHHITKR